MIIDNKDYFTLDEIKNAFENTKGVIVGVDVIKDVLDGMNQRNLGHVDKIRLSDSERECIEFGLGYRHWIH